MHDSSPGARATADLVARRSDTAWKAWRTAPCAQRGAVIRRLADTLDAARNELADIAASETGLGRQRLVDEAHRAAVTARLVADSTAGTLARATVTDPADPERVLGAHTRVERRPLPLGPVLNFAASNFPFGFSVLGGDTVAALAAGCTVICKAHPGHPRLSRATAGLLRSELTALGLPEDLLQLVEGDELGRALLTHPLVRAATFTGSFRVGSELFRLAANREVPIPFFGELGSVNPVFVLPSAARDAEDLAEQIVSFTSWSCGQVCTKPGIVFVPDDVALDGPIRAAAARVEPQRFLHPGIAAGFAQRQGENAAVEGVETILPAGGTAVDPASANVTPGFARITLDAYLAAVPVLSQEVFGPYGLIVSYDRERELFRLPEVVDALPGSLTAAIQSDPAHAVDAERAVLARLSEELPYRVGRLIFNQWTTEMSITRAQHHGGPWPATTSDGIATTALGPAGILRFTRAVAFQNQDG